MGVLLRYFIIAKQELCAICFVHSYIINQLILGIMRHFKTIKGFVNSSYLQVTIESIMSGRTTFCHNGTYKHENFKLSSDAIREIAKGFSEYLYSTKERANEVFDAFMQHRGDYSFFQCFYVEWSGNSLRFSTSLSGEAFNYCRREFMKSI